MADHAKSGVLVANVVSTVTLDLYTETALVLNRTGSAEIWIRADGTDPTIAGDDCLCLAAAIGAIKISTSKTSAGKSEVRLISAATPTYFVTSE